MVGIKVFALSIFLLGNLACSVVGIRTVEEATYTVRLAEEDKEIRDYNARIVAKTTIDGAYKDAQKEAFRILADYIFGKNTGKQEIAMTAPVTQESSSSKIAMTAPVTQSKTEGGWTLSFAMPSKYQEVSQVPQPIDKRIKLEKRPGGTFAVIQFTWLTNEERNKEKTQDLLQWLENKKQYQAISNPVYAGYDPPWTLPFLRRQEILLEIKKLD